MSEEHVNIDVEWASADESGLDGGSVGVVTVTAEQNTGRTERHGNAVVSIGGMTKNVMLTQHGKDAFVQFDEPSYSIGADGGFITITGKANTRAMGFSCAADAVTIPTYFSITTSDGVVHGNENAEYQMFASDPGAIAEYSFRIVISVPNNVNEEARQFVIECSDREGVTESVVITQEAGSGDEPIDGEEFVRFLNPNIVCDNADQVVNLFLESNAYWTINIYG